jgi:hypothetical protein
MIARNEGVAGDRMYSVSIKGIVLGSLFDLIATFAFAFLLGIYLAISHGGDPEATMLAANSGGWLAFSVIVACVLTVVAGYLAAWIAGRGELTNGTLSAVFSAAIMLPMTWDQPMPWSATVTVLMYMTMPLLGLLGGYLRSRQVNAG